MKASCEELFDEAMDYRRYRQSRDWSPIVVGAIVGLLLYVVFKALHWI